MLFLMQPADFNKNLIAPSINQLDEDLKDEEQQSANKDGSINAIPILEEQVQIEKQVVETGQVRLVKTVEATGQTVATSLNQEEFIIERVPIEQYVDVAPATRQEGETTVYPVMREVLVVEKRLLLVEGVRVTKRLTQRTDQQTVNLRQEDIRIKRTVSTNEHSA